MVSIAYSTGAGVVGGLRKDGQTRVGWGAFGRVNPPGRAAAEYVPGSDILVYFSVLKSLIIVLLLTLRECKE
jgi:hypothetical protein